MNIFEAIQIVEQYIQQRKGVSVNINPLKVISSERQLMLLEHSLEVAIEYFENKKIIIS